MGNWTCNLSVYGTMLQPTESPSQAHIIIFRRKIKHSVVGETTQILAAGPVWDPWEELGKILAWPVFLSCLPGLHLLPAKFCASAEPFPPFPQFGNFIFLLLDPESLRVTLVPSWTPGHVFSQRHCHVATHTLTNAGSNTPETDTKLKDAYSVYSNELFIYNSSYILLSSHLAFVQESTLVCKIPWSWGKRSLHPVWTFSSPFPSTL